jgi:hypothetical protein
VKASEVYAKAAEELLKRGHAKRTLEDDYGGVCIAGAINCGAHGDAMWRFVSTDGWSPVTTGTFIDGVSAVVGEYAIGWNNRDERTPDEVVAALDAARVLALQEEGTEPEDVL